MQANYKINQDGSFRLENPERFSYLYFPLTNDFGTKSVITPSLNGTLTKNQNEFTLLPISVEDIPHSLFGRNFFIKTDSFLWSITGDTPHQRLYPDKVVLEGEILKQKVTRTRAEFGVTIESFVPVIDEVLELHKITIKNTTQNVLVFQPTMSVPLYSRSAENIRDHRHVTSLLNQITICEKGIINQPTFSFDERGHNVNQISYGAFINTDHNVKVKTYYPTIEEFICGGNLHFPHSLNNQIPTAYTAGDSIEGYEALSAISFNDIHLNPSEEVTFIIGIGQSVGNDGLEKMMGKYIN